MISQTAKILLELIFNGIFFKMSRDDMKSYQIKQKDLILFLLLGIIQTMIFVPNPLSRIVFAIFFFFFWHLIWLKNSNKIGGGDIKIFGILALLFGEKVLLIIIFASLSAIFHSKLFRINKVPFVPFLYGGALFLNIMTFLIT